MADRKSISLPGRGHRGGVIPMGSRIGNVVYSSAIGGRVPGGGGELTDDLDKQAETMFENMKAFMELAGGTVDDIIFVMLLLKDRATRDYVDKHWALTFPDEDSRPARFADGAGWRPADAGAHNGGAEVAVRTAITARRSPHQARR